MFRPNLLAKELQVFPLELGDGHLPEAIDFVFQCAVQIYLPFSGGVNLQHHEGSIRAHYQVRLRRLDATPVAV
jgi:hypothetical protein